MPFLIFLAFLVGFVLLCSMPANQAHPLAEALRESSTARTTEQLLLLIEAGTTLHPGHLACERGFIAPWSRRTAAAAAVAAAVTRRARHRHHHHRASFPPLRLFILSVCAACGTGGLQRESASENSTSVGAATRAGAGGLKTQVPRGMSSPPRYDVLALLVVVFAGVVASRRLGTSFFRSSSCGGPRDLFLLAVRCACCTSISIYYRRGGGSLSLLLGVFSATLRDFEGDSPLPPPLPPPANSRG